MSIYLETALEYLQKKWPVFPVMPKGKAPLGALVPQGFQDATTDEAQVRAWWERQPDANIGLPTGAATGFDVLDIDAHSGGGETLEDWYTLHGRLPHTVESQTGGGGRHIFFHHYDGVKSSVKKIAPGIDVRGEGGYIVAPPSMHESGRRYEWELSSGLLDIDPAPWPPWLLELVLDLATDKEGQAPPLPDHLHEGARNTNLTSLAGSMRRRGAVEVAIVAALEKQNEQCCVPPLETKEVQDIAHSVARYKPAAIPIFPLFQPRNGQIEEAQAQAQAFPGELHEFSDMGNACRLVNRYGTLVRYVSLWKRWLIWSGQRWASDEIGQIVEMAKDTVLAIAEQEAGIKLAPPNKDGDQKDWALDHCKKSQKETWLKAMVKLSQSQAPLPLVPDDLDQHPWLFNVENGTLDLKSGFFFDADPAHYLTQQAAVHYDEGATCPAWEQFIHDIFAGNTNLIAFAQRMLGYCLTGTTTEEVCFFWHGGGDNGKSILIEVFTCLLATYAKNTPPQTFMETRLNDGVRNDLAALKSTRFVIAAEANQKQRLDEALVKRLTGGDQVEARFLYEEYFTYTPQFKMVLTCNSPPIIEGQDHGIWRRIRLVPFEVKFEGAAKRPKEELQGELLAELPGILNWCLAGCLQWQKEGLGCPPEVSVATMQYREEMDDIGEFLSECIEADPDLQISNSDLYRVYQQWERKHPLGRKTLTQQLKQRGYVMKRTSERYWEGITLTSHGQRLLLQT